MVAPSHSTQWLAARLRAGGPAELVLRGFSMAPALRDGDRLMVVPLGGRPPAPGEIVVAQRGGLLVTHRTVAVRGDRTLLRGDACHRDDPPLHNGELLGRVTAVRRGARLLPPPARRPSWRLTVARIRQWIHWGTCQ